MNTPLEKGIAAAKSGHKKEAADYLQEALRNNPNDVLALLWLAGVSEPIQQEKYLRQVLQIDPNNQHAQQGLKQIAHLQSPQQDIPPMQRLKPQSSPQRNPNLQPQNSNPQNLHQVGTDSTGTIAMLIEIVFGLFGMMGIGWLYVGKYLVGLLLFMGFFVIFWLEVGFGISSGGLCFCGLLPFNILLSFISGLRLRDHVRRTRAKGSIIYLFIAIFVAILACVAAMILAPMLVGNLGNIFPQFTN